MFSIRSALAAFLVLGGAAVVAQAQQPTTPAPQAHARKGMWGGPGRGGAGADRALLRGITLSDAEKANLKAVHQKYAAQMKAINEQYKPQREQIRAARQRGDTAAVRSLMAQNTGERDQMRSVMTAERNDIRGALTPDNQAKFDANAANMKKRFSKFGKGRANGQPETGVEGL